MMPHNQSWLVKNHVVYVVFSGEMGSKDIGDAFHDSATHVLESTESPVHFLHNWQDVKKFPTSLSDVFKASQNSKAPIRKVGWVVAFGKHSKLFKFMGDIFFQLFNLRFRLFGTAEEAIEFLCKQDERLDQAVMLSEKTRLDQLPDKPDERDEL